MPIPVAAIVELITLIRGLYGKKVKVTQVKQALGAPDAIAAYLSGCAKLQAAADAHEPFGPLTVEEVAAISKADDVIVRIATKLQKKLV